MLFPIISECKNNQLTQARLLVVNIDSHDADLIHDTLAPDHQLFKATNNKHALRTCFNMMPDLIVLNLLTTDTNGLQLCYTLKQHPKTQAIPVIIVTALRSYDDETVCWKAGCVDLVSKPFNPITLKNRVHVHITLTLQTAALQKLVWIDGLTGIANRRYFDEQLKNEFSRAWRTQQPLTLLMIDINFFKYYNDRYGHQTGDRYLQQIAAVLKNNVRRSSDFVARYGGDEFACILPYTDEKGAQVVEKKLITAVKSIAFNKYPAISISIGRAVLDGTKKILSVEALIYTADSQLYNSKHKIHRSVATSQKTDL
jgi:diguanylate cyclase (GGDEF)-like protein